MKLKKVTEKDYEFLYELLKNRDPEANISHKEMPTRGMSDFFNSNNPYKYDFIIMVDGERIGRTYLTKNNEIGLFLIDKYQRKGYGKKVINSLIEITDEVTYLANVSPTNVKGNMFFDKLGFKLVQQTYKYDNYKEITYKTLGKEKK